MSEKCDKTKKDTEAVELSDEMLEAVSGGRNEHQKKQIEIITGVWDRAEREGLG